MPEEENQIRIICLTDSENSRCAERSLIILTRTGQYDYYFVQTFISEKEERVQEKFYLTF